MLGHKLANQAGPLLLPRLVVPLDGPIVPLQADEQAVGEVACDAKVVKKIYTVATTTKTSSNWGGT